MDVVRKIGSAPTNERDRPINPIVIRTITVERQQS